MSQGRVHENEVANINRTAQISAPSRSRLSRILPHISPTTITRFVASVMILGRLGRNGRLFRLSKVREKVATYHEGIGLRLEHMEMGSELCTRLGPDMTEFTFPLYDEDILIQLKIDGA
jgi:hypothetical protein